MHILSKASDQHFLNPEMDHIEKADGIGRRCDPESGVMVIFYIKTKDNIVDDIAYKIKACPVAIAYTSVIHHIVKHKSMGRVLEITLENIEAVIGTLPGEKKCISR